MARTWFITGVSSGFGNQMTKQLLSRGDTVIGTARSAGKLEGLKAEYPETFDLMLFDMTDIPAVHDAVRMAFGKHDRIDVLVSNAGYGLFGCAEELPESEIDKILATNLQGPIMLIRDFIPYMRRQGGGRIIQLSSYGGQVAYPANSLYHATKFGIEGFCESVAQEISQFGIMMTIVEPGGARTEFRYSSARVTPNLMPCYEAQHGFLKMLDPANGLAPGDPAKMAARMIETVDMEHPPLRLVLGSAALKATIDRLEERIADYRKQEDVARSTDITERSRSDIGERSQTEPLSDDKPFLSLLIETTCLMAMTG